MTNQSSYIMQEQVRDLIPSIMTKDIKRKLNKPDLPVHVWSVLTLSGIYLVTLALTS